MPADRLRTLGVVAAALAALPGCPGPGRRPAASVDGASLSADRLAQLLVLAQPVPLRRDVAYELASHWVTLTAFARRMALGDSLLDSATIADLMSQRARRQILERWRADLLAGVPGGDTARFSSAYARRLVLAGNAELKPRAVAIARSVASDPWGPRDAGDTVATFTGGAVTSRDLARYTQYAASATRQEMRDAPEGRISDFLWGLVLDELLLRQADSAGVRLEASQFLALADDCRKVIHRLWDGTGLSPGALASAAPLPAERRKLAARLVDAYLEAAAARRLPLEPVPPFLAVPLLRDVAWDIVPDQMDSAVARARRLLAGTGEPPAVQHPQDR
jgi:hypothetical protein